MKLAHLILAHKNPGQLARLIARLAHADSHFYIHIDQKTDITPFLFLTENQNVFFISNRVRVFWAGYSQVQSTLNSFEEIIARGNNYDYINLISGQDYPLQSATGIHRYLSENPGKAFMEYYPVYTVWKEAIPRISEYFFTESSFPGKYYVEQLLNKLLPVRKLPGAMEPVGRSTWFTITSGQVAYILDFVRIHPAYVRFFKKSWGADELFFQTILYNSPAKKDMVNNNLLYVDWSKGGPNPKMLTMADAGALMSSGKLWARKFDDTVDKEILDYIDKAIDQNSSKDS